MTVKVQWDTDAEKTGLPDTGSDTKQYAAGTEGEHQVVVTSETDPSRTQTVTFTIPLDGGGGGTLTPDKTEVDSSGDEAARTISVTGSGFPASQTGTIALHPGEPGSGGTAVVTANVTADAQGAFPATPLIVPQDQAEGSYHIVGTVGGTVSDETGITVTTGGGGGTLTVDKTEVDSSGDEAARTVSVTGAGLPASAAGRVAIMTGAPGSGGTEVIGADVTADASGNLAATPLIVPQDQEAGDYHVVGTFGETVIDDNPLTVTTGGGGGTLTPDKTEVDSSGDEAARTVSVTGAGFPASTAGRLAIMTGEPGSGGTEVIGADVSSDASGNVPATPLIVPEATAEGPHHITGTFGDVTSDDTALAITTGGGGGALTLDKTEVDSAGDEAARTVSVTGTGLPASATGRVAIMTGAPGSGGTEVVGADVTADASGNLAASPLIVPQDQAEGDYHVVGTFGETVIDDNPLTVTSGGGGGTLTPDKTEVDSSGDEAARTVSVTGTGFTASATGRLAIHDGAPGSGGTEVVGADVTADAQGAIPATPLIVPQDQADGDYHILTSGDVGVSDNTALTVTAGGGGGTLTADKTEVSLAGDEAARTVSVTGAGFTASAAGHIAINTGAPGSGGTEVVGADVTADAQGAIAATPLIVPTTATAGEHHILTSGDMGVADETALTVTA